MVVARDVDVKLNLPGIREVLKSSGVQGMLAPSATTWQPLVASALACSVSSSFWVAHGSATLAGTSQMEPVLE